MTKFGPFWNVLNKNMFVNYHFAFSIFRCMSDVPEIFPAGTEFQLLFHVIELLEKMESSQAMEVA